MKALGCVLVVGLVVVAGFVGVLVWSLHLEEDQSSLTERVDLRVVGPEEEYRSGQGTGYQLDYTYEAGGRTFAGDDWIRDNYWRPGRPLTACVDPDDPRSHVVTVHDQACGRKYIVGGTVQEAVPAD